MAYRNDSSPYHARWSNKKLVTELRRRANFESFSSFFCDEPVSIGQQMESGDFIREETRIYRDTWVNPLLNEIERRLGVQPSLTETTDAE